MDKYLKVAIGIAVLSILVSGGIFFTTISDITNIYNESDHLKKFDTISNISTAISAIFGLLIGSIAIIAVIVSQKSENTSIEFLKVDLVSLVGTLVSIRNRCYLYTNTSLINYDLDLFETEKTKLQSFLGSSSGYVIYIWNLQTKSTTDLDISIQLSSIIDFLTLKVTNQNASNLFNSVAIRCEKLIDLLTEISNKDFKGISYNLTKIGKGLRQVKDFVKSDKLSELAQSMIDSEGEKINNVEFPNDEFIKKVIDNANNKIGGKAEDTVIQLLNEAKSGNKKSLDTFYKMVQQLKLDE